MGYYNITVEPDNVLRLSFDTPAENNTLVQEATQIINTLINGGLIKGGALIKLTGAQSIPIAYALAHKLSHLYQAVAVYDPKLLKFVVSIVHGGKYSLGDLMD